MSDKPCPHTRGAYYCILERGHRGAHVMQSLTGSVAEDDEDRRLEDKVDELQDGDWPEHRLSPERRRRW